VVYTQCYKEYDCGCEIATDGYDSYEIEYCPKHRSAPDLYEACKEAEKTIAEALKKGTFLPNLNRAVIKALAKAEGK